MGSLRGELQCLQKHLDQLDRIFRLLPAVDFQMVSALVREACHQENQDAFDRGVDLMNKLSEVLLIDSHNQQRPVKVLSYGDCESVQV